MGGFFMKKIVVLMVTLVILLSCVAIASAGTSGQSDEKLQSFSYPKSWENREVIQENGSPRLIAFSSDKSFEFGVDFNTDVDSKNLVEVDHGIYRDGNTVLEVFELDGVKYHAFVKYNGTDNISSHPDKIKDADHELFKFNKLNDLSRYVVTLK